MLADYEDEKIDGIIFDRASGSAISALTCRRSPGGPVLRITRRRPPAQARAYVPPRSAGTARGHVINDRAVDMRPTMTQTTAGWTGNVSSRQRPVTGAVTVTVSPVWPYLA